MLHVQTRVTSTLVTKPERDHPHDPILDVIAEFSETFSFIRTRWTEFTEQLHPELSGGSIFVLQVILKKGPITATEIGHRLRMDKAMISRQVALLRKLELVDAQAAAEDRRVTLLTGTELARTRLDEVRSQMSEQYRQRFADWGAEDIVQLRDLLRRFNGSADFFEDSASPSARCTPGHVAQDPASS